MRKNHKGVCEKKLLIMESSYSFFSRLKWHVGASHMLILYSILALLCANLPATRDLYFGLWNKTMAVSIGDFNLFSHGGHTMTLADVINDFLMAIFFLSVGLEIKREILVGELSTVKKAMLPIIGACGGMLVPVLIFWLVCPDDATMLRGVAIPMATDIAFSLGVLAIFSKRVPTGLKVFLAALAVADDLGGIIVIALFYSTELNITFLLISLCIALFLVVSNLVFKIRPKTYYLVVGFILWFCMLNSGVHATIAGVIVAFCVPCTIEKSTAYYLQRIRRNVEKFPKHEEIIESKKHSNAVLVLTNGEKQTLKSIESAADHLISPLQSLEDHLNGLVNMFIIPLFAFANAGINFSGMHLSALYSGVGLAVILGLVIGKFLGVFSFSWLAIKCRLVVLPEGSTWKSFASVCVLCGIGFTVSIFIAGLSYSGAGELGQMYLNEAKLGILVGTVLSAIIGSICLNFTLPASPNKGE